MITIRPHHLLDIIRDFGNDATHEGEHPWGAAVASVTRDLLADVDQTVELVMGVDSICETCSKLNGQICEALIGDDLLMREYNDPLDESLFAALGLSPGTQLTVTEFLTLVGSDLGILDLFTRPAGKPEIRERGTRAALDKLGIPQAT